MFVFVWFFLRKTQTFPLNSFKLIIKIHIVKSKFPFFRYGPDETFSSRKMEKAPYHKRGDTPSHTLPPSVPSLPHNLNSPIVFLSRNFLLKYAQNCTFSSRKMKKLPTIWEGGHPPPDTPLPHPPSHRSLLSLAI